MLSIGAFNALSEDAGRAAFLCDLYSGDHRSCTRFPITILSRCQRYDFKRISIETIATGHRELMEKEQVEVEEKALRYIAKKADGSMRDALSLLDQCIAFYLGQKLTYDQCAGCAGSGGYGGVQPAAPGDSSNNDGSGA